jgi:hypothetical protein
MNKLRRPHNAHYARAQARPVNAQPPWCRPAVPSPRVPKCIRLTHHPAQDRTVLANGAKRDTINRYAEIVSTTAAGATTMHLDVDIEHAARIPLRIHAGTRMAGIRARASSTRACATRCTAFVSRSSMSHASGSGTTSHLRAAREAGRERPAVLLWDGRECDAGPYVRRYWICIMYVLQYYNA